MRELTFKEVQDLRSKYGMETAELGKVLPHIEIEEISDDRLHKNYLSFKCPFFGRNGCEYQLLKVKGTEDELNLDRVALAAHLIIVHS